MKCARGLWTIGVLGVVVLLTLLVGPAGTEGAAQEAASIALESGQVAVGETVELDVRLVPPRGLQRFDLTIIVANGNVAEIAEITAQGINPNFVRIVNQNATAIRVQGVDLDNQITSTQTPIALLSVTLEGRNAGTTDLSLADAQAFDETGSPYTVNAQGATLEVTESDEDEPDEPDESPETEPQPLPGADALPQDLDGDGLLEDTNGDGQFTAADVALFALHWDSAAVQNRPAAFDFNGDGNVNGDDPFALADLLDASQPDDDGPEAPESPAPEPGSGVTALELTGGPFLVDETSTVTLRLIGAPTGLQSYRIRLRTSGTGLEIVDTRGLATSAGLTQARQLSEGVLEIQAVDVDDRITGAAQDVALAEIDVRPRQPGDAEISLDVVTFIDDRGRALDPFVRPLSLSITPIVSPIGDADQPPRDLNGDGLYEDINGDGSLTDADVILLALNLNASEVQENASLFDFNGDGSVDFADVQALRRQLEARTAGDGGTHDDDDSPVARVAPE